MMICFVMTQEFLAEVDTHRELAKIHAEFGRYKRNKDFTVRTQEHMNSGVETLLGTMLPLASRGSKMTGQLWPAPNPVHNMVAWRSGFHRNNL
jgi:hypothetical protein